MKKLIFLSLLLLPGICLPAYSQTNNDVLKDAVAKLRAFTAEHVLEKAYLHFDKSYYAAGDTIYFKAYLTMGERHLPSRISGVLHVDLINTNNKVDQAIKLQVTDGVAWGDFALPDSLPKGNYRVRAYTRWMRNDKNYFERLIPVGTISTNKIPENTTARIPGAGSKPDMQFFPEGGGLIAGITSKIAFKAVGTNGLGIGAKGVLMDDAGNAVGKFESAHLGMGYFYLKPEPGKTYHAEISYANGVEDRIVLPAASPKGITLSIGNDSVGMASVQIMANDEYFAENRDKSVNLLVYSGGIAHMVTTRLDSAKISLAIIKRHLHTGITRVTLFSADGEPLSERLIFIQNPDQLKLTVSGNKISYGKREKVHLAIRALDRTGSTVTGHFSVSVTDVNSVPADENAENTIINGLLLTSDLKGYIEQPNYYFTNVTGKTRADLDLVMLTHGYRRFEWKQLLNDSYPGITYQPENNLQITGVAKNLFGKPLDNATVSLIPMHKGPFLSETTNDKGQFRFNNLVFGDTAKFILQATNSKGRNSTKLTFNNDEAAPVVGRAAGGSDEDADLLMKAYLENSRMQHDEMARYGTINGKVLDNVTINSTKTVIQPLSGNRMISSQFVNQAVRGDELEKSAGVFLSDKLLGKFHGRAVNPFTGKVNAGLVVLDGVAMPSGFNIDDLNPYDVEAVESVYGPEAAIYGMRASGGVLLITTKQGRGVDAKDIVSIGILPISPKGFYKAREFYSPQYDHPAQQDERADLRTTIFWKPELATAKDGTASLDYYNADGHGDYRVVVEGIAENGDIGRQVYEYKVE